MMLNLKPVMARVRHFNQATPVTSLATPPSDPVSELERLAALLKSGVLTDDEFKNAKEGILKKLG